MKIKTWQIGICIIAIMFGGIAIASMFGLWKTEGGKQPNRIKSGEFAGASDPGDIRGSYSFLDISKAFDIPIEDLGNAFGLTPSQYSVFKCKDLKTIYEPLAEIGKEVGTGSVRYFVALYTGLPYDSEETSYLPSQAVDILIEKAELTTEQLVELENARVTLP